MATYMTTAPGVYEIRNVINGHTYIGQSFNLGKRWALHKNNLKSSKAHNAHLQNAWNKYGAEAFTFTPLAIFNPPPTKRELTDMEQDYVDFFVPEYNICKECVDSSKGVKVTAETRRKMSAAAKARDPKTRKGGSKPHTAEFREALSARMMGERFALGRKHTADELTKMSLAHRAHYSKPENRAHQSLVMTEWWAQRKERGQ